MEAAPGDSLEVGREVPDLGRIGRWLPRFSFQQLIQRSLWDRQPAAPVFPPLLNKQKRDTQTPNVETAGCASLTGRGRARDPPFVFSLSASDWSTATRRVDKLSQVLVSCIALRSAAHDRALRSVSGRFLPQGRRSAHRVQTQTCVWALYGAFTLADPQADPQVQMRHYSETKYN